MPELHAESQVSIVSESSSSDEDEPDYDSDNELPAMTFDRLSRKLKGVLYDAELDLATLPDYDKPYDEHYIVADAKPCLRAAKSAVVEMYEAMNFYREFLRCFHNAPRNSAELIAQIFHVTEQDNVVVRWSLAVDAYVSRMRDGRMLQVDQHPEDEPDPATVSFVRADSVFNMRNVRTSSHPDLRAARKDEPVEATGASLLKMLTDLQSDLHAGLRMVGLEAPVTWRVLVPRIVYVQQDGTTQYNA
jgi:hypothetical protein